MPKSIFFNNKIEDRKFDPYVYSVEYVYYFICSLLYKKGPISKEKIIDEFISFYGENINSSFLASFLNRYFHKKTGKYSLSLNQLDKFTKVVEAEKVFNDNNLDHIKIYEKLNNSLDNHMFDVNKASQYFLTLYKNNDSSNINILLSKYFVFILKKESYYRELDLVAQDITDFYDSFEVYSLFDDDVIKKTLYIFQINSIKQLKEKSIDFLLTIFSFNVKKNIAILSSLKKMDLTDFKGEALSTFNALNEYQRTILSYRNGLNEDVEHTLEECGRIYGFSRERARQIEASATKKILTSCSNIYFKFLSIFFHLTNIERDYITKDELNNFIGDKFITNFIVFIVQNGSFDIKYNKDYLVFLNSKKTSVEDIVNFAITEIGPIIKIDKTINLDSFYQNVLKNKYTLRFEIYLSRNLNINDLISDVMFEVFPNGYKMGNEEDYLLLKEKFIEKYGKSDDFMTMCAISARLDSNKFCLVDKGTYKPREYCAILPENLLNDIKEFILSKFANGEPVVHYRSIFEQFKNNLNSLGINNSFYLKGLLDPNLGEDNFTTKRNYVRSSDSDLTAVQSMANTLRSFNSIFTLDDFRNKYIGVKDYVLYSVITSEESNGLLMLSNKRFIYYNKLNIDETVIEEFKTFLDNIFLNMNTKFLHTSKVYARLMLQNDLLLKKLKIQSYFSLFSLAKYSLKKYYIFKRPFIFDKSFGSGLNSFELVVNYASSLEYFNKEIIDSFIQKMNIRDLLNYSDFIEIMSDNYVQISNGTLVKKEKIKINNDDLNRLSDLLDLIINKSGDIDTKEFSGYSMLPTLNYKWNKYLLAGIVRTFLTEEYTVDNYGSDYRVADFIIKKV